MLKPALSGPGHGLLARSFVRVSRSERGWRYVKRLLADRISGSKWRCAALTEQHHSLCVTCPEEIRLKQADYAALSAWVNNRQFRANCVRSMDLRSRLRRVLLDARLKAAKDLHDHCIDVQTASFLGSAASTQLAEIQYNLELLELSGPFRCWKSDTYCSFVDA